MLDSATTHSILRDKNYFSSMTLRKANVHTISRFVEIIEGFGNAIIMLPNGTILHIEDALLTTKTKKNLLSFKDLCHNGYHLETINDNDIDCLCIISYKMEIKTIHKKLKASISRLYCVLIRAIKSYTTMSWKLINPNEFGLWLDRIGHPGATMMHRIILNLRRHHLKNT